MLLPQQCLNNVQEVYTKHWKENQILTCWSISSGCPFSPLNQKTSSGKKMDLRKKHKCWTYLSLKKGNKEFIQKILLDCHSSERQLSSLVGISDKGIWIWILPLSFLNFPAIMKPWHEYCRRIKAKRTPQMS